MITSPIPTARLDCVSLDARDPLAPLRQQFQLPAGTVYLDGNSLGALPRNAAARVQQVIEREWGDDLIQSWNKAGWMSHPQRVADKIGRLIGAAPGEAIVADTTLAEPLQGAQRGPRVRQGRCARWWQAAQAHRLRARQLSHRPVHRRKPGPATWLRVGAGGHR